jgi:NitT/TauT family transport system substrate-binding protein
VVSGAFEHTLNMQAKSQKLRAFALQGRAPQIVLGLRQAREPEACEGVSGVRTTRTPG